MVAWPNDTLMQSVDPEHVGRAQAQAGMHEGEVVLVASAHDDGIHLGRRAILEGALAPLDLGEEWHRGEVVWPMESHRCGAIRTRHAFHTVLVALGGDVLGRVRGADHENVLPGELLRRAEIVRMHHATLECLETSKRRHVRRREVACATCDVVELFDSLLACGRRGRHHSKDLTALVEGHILDHSVEHHPILDTGLLHTADDVVMQHLARRVARDRLAKVLRERVICKFKALLGPVRPQVPVH
mmetsp:Transcript_104190/g.261260  ORF Transcript_104190/g.261260 Transcript_104190/m.261260 type:complete len:244 (+) Transcript_104190:559-1290(+)